jgi:hypothetical protein
MLFVMVFMINSFVNAQTLTGTWKCLYATWDEETNGAGYPVIDVGVISEDNFVALVSRASKSSYYLVGYKDADSSHGRMGTFGYGSAMANFHTIWYNMFDQVELNDPNALAAKGNLVYVANNDPEHNILVFEYMTDSVYSYPARMSTGSDYLWAIDLDDAGRVYVTQTPDANSVGKVLIFESIANDPSWGSGLPSAPLHTITMPEPGSIRGIAVDPSAQAIYVSNYTARKVYCFTGTPQTGYTLNPSFSCTIDDMKIGTVGDTVKAGPWGLKFLKEKNILFVASAANFQTGSGYELNNFYALNPNTGEKIGQIDIAAWNFLMTGAYNNRTGGTTPGNASGYTSNYNIEFDENNYLYTQSYFGWTVEKWVYEGTFPVIPLTIVGVEKLNTPLPVEFNLSQNYPNPFNPTTTIEFSITNDSKVSLDIYSITGELITSLINNSELSKGTYKYTFDASKLASGTYIYKLTNGINTISKKMTLIK